MKTTSSIQGIVFLLFYTFSAIAQIPTNSPTALSPNAASLGLYGDVPVSHFTGTPNISIPLYALKVGDFTLPISLSYHSGGIRPDQRASWVGLGWTLNAGGIITRKVNDMIDEYNDPYGYKEAGYYYNHNVLNTASWNQRDYLRSVAQDTEKAIKDTAPDEFFFNFVGYNGKFCLDHNGYWKVQCDKPVKVEFDGDFMDLAQKLDGTILAERADRCYTFKHFTLIVEDGTKYVFGGDMDAIELSIDFFGQNADSWIATSWYLTEIILPTGQRINLTYEREETEFINQMYAYAYQNLGTYLYSEGNGLGADVSCEYWTFGTAELKYGGKLLSPVYLTEITTSNIVISFYRSVSNELKYNQSIYDKYYEYYQKYDNSGEPFLPLLSLGYLSYPRCLDNLKWYKLDRITIERFLTESVDIHKNISLGYNNDPSQRLILERVAETGKKPYTFSYNQADKLPGYLSNQLDHWGFYNGKEAILNYATYHTYKTPDSTCTVYGVLKRITYPTGGYTEFEFEPHDYRKQLRLNRWEGHETLSGNNLAGGVRIKKITSVAGGDAPKITKEYYYVSDYIEKRDNASISSGVLGGQAQYYFTDYHTSAFNVGNNVYTEILMNAFSTVSVLPASQNTSCHIGYTEVIEKLADNSFTRYQFSNFDNGYNDEPADAIIQLSRTPYESYASKSMDRGKLILQEHYNANGTRIWRKAITYEKDASTNNYVRAMNATNTVVCYNAQAAYDEGTSYKIYTYMLRPKTETITSYNAESGNAMQTTTMQYTYTNKLLQSATYTNSDGQRKQTVYRYPLDYANTSSIYAEMREKHQFSYVVEKAEITGSGADARVVDIVRTHYDKTPAGFFKPKRVDWSFAETMDLDTYNEQGSAAVLAPFTYYQHDDQGNIVEILSAACYGENTSSQVEAVPAGEGTATVYLWGYCGQYLIAKITNCTYQTICNIIGNGNVEAGTNALKTMSRREAPTEEEWATINNLRQTLPISLVTSYTYKPLTGMTSQTDPQGRTIYYEYDNANRLIEIYRMSGGHKEQLQTYEYHYAEDLNTNNL